MNDYAARLSATMRRVGEAERVRRARHSVRVLVAPPLGRGRVWAGFHLPPAWLRFAGWECDYLASQRRAMPYRTYERRIGARARSAYQQLARGGARVSGDARRRDVDEALSATDVEAIILVGHHTGDGIELADGIMPGHALTQMLEARAARGAFDFVWVVCRSIDWRGEVLSVAPDILPFSAPLIMELPAALESIVWWVEALDGQTPFHIAQQKALVRQWPLD